MRTCLSIALIVALVAGAAQAAGVVSLQLISQETHNGLPFANLAPGDAAGAVNVANWNSSLVADPGSGVADWASVVDDDGAGVAGMSAAFAGGNGDRFKGRSDYSTNEQKMFRNGYDATGGGNTLTATGIPFAAYDVYVYVTNEQYRIASITAGGVTKYIQGGKGLAGVDEYPANAASYVEADWTTPVDLGDEQTALDVPSGHYVVMRNLSGDLSLDVTALTDVDQNPFNSKAIRAYIGGFQIVEVPEPATMSLLGLGGLALLRRKRK